MTSSGQHDHQAHPPQTALAIRAGLADAAPILLGAIPFGLVAGAAPIATGLDVAHAVGLSVLVFAGASQLAMVDVFGSDGGALLAVVTALTINLRLTLYSASLAPMLAHVSLVRRLQMSYLLVDQVYAVSVTRWDGNDDRRVRVPYYLAYALLLWGCWLLTTLVGAIVGARVPDDVPLDFAIPLVFLVLLVPAVKERPSIVAAVTGGIVAVVTAEVGYPRLAIMIGGLCGIVAGALAETVTGPPEARGTGSTAGRGGP